jgi:hypothetical protein
MRVRKGRGRKEWNMKERNWLKFGKVGDYGRPSA